MPIRIMMWNVENFSISKRNNNTWDRNQLRWNHILDTIRQVNPDIFVLIEVGSGGVAAGAIATGGAAAGVLRLFDDLNSPPPPPVFSVVPPIVSGKGGKREGIAIFFKHANLRFTGPWVWNGTASSPPRLRTGTVTRSPYNGNWAAALPNTHNQNEMAGQWMFSDTPTASDPRAAATNYFPSEGNRSLFLTDFLDTSVTPNRRISLFAIHSPPQPNLAVKIPGVLAEVREVKSAPGANEVKVILGDFNINVRNHAQRVSFNDLSETFFPPGKRARADHPRYIIHNINTPTVLKGVSGKSRITGMTYKHTARIAASIHDQALPPPYYDYIGTDIFNGGEMLALDNILTRHGQTAGNAANFHVVNRVYQNPAQFPYPPDLGLMNNGAVAATIPLIRARYRIGSANQDTSSANSFFRNYGRFGKIGAARGASDHMALVIDV